MAISALVVLARLLVAVVNKVRIEPFPDALVARFMGARPFEPLKFAQERADVARQPS